MSQNIANVIVAGAGGNLGPSIVSALLSEPSFNVSILSRADSTATFPAGVKVIKTDYSHDSLVESLKGQDAVVSSLAGVAIPIQKSLVDAAIEAGVKRFLPTEFGNDTSNAKALQLVPVFGHKKDVVDYCKSKESEISWTGIVNGPFLDWGLQVGFLGFSLSDKKATLYEPGHAQPFSLTTRATAGLAVARALLPKYNAQTKNRYVYVRSVTTTQDEILAAFEKVGGEKWETKTVLLDPLIQKANEGITKGDFSGIGIMILGAVMDPDTGMDFDKRGIVENEFLGLPETTLEEEVKALL